MPSDSTLTATIAYEGSKRAQISDLTVELIPLTVALNGTPITSYTVTVTDYWGQPSTFAAPDAAGSARGVLVGPGTAHELGTGTWRVWVHYDGDPEDITRRADGWIEVAGASLEVSAALSVVSLYQLRAERGQPGGYATLDGAGLVAAAQLPLASGSDPLKQDVSGKGVAGGYASLDGSGTVPTAQLPATLATDAEVTAAVAGKANTSHTHAEADVTSLTTDLSTLTSAVAGKAATSHTHAEADVTSLTTDLGLKAPLASPALTGNPTAPTQTAGNNSTRLATTAYADTGLALKAASSHTHAEADVTSLTTDLGLKAPLASPALTGTPTAPTASANTNTTQVATTAYVDTAVVIDTQTFTANGTWTKPPWATAASVTQMRAIADGGGGASGCRRSSGSNRSGGGAGAGGSMSIVEYPTSALPSTATVVVGQGGAGGAAKTTDNADGAVGTVGTGCSVHNGAGTYYVYTFAGNASVGGQAGGGTSAGGTSNGGMFTGSTGGSSAAGSAGSTSGAAAAASGGGGGGGISTGDASFNGGFSGVAHSTSPTQSQAGVAGGASPTTGVSAAVGTATCGTGGGGGASSTTATAQTGAAGGRYGGGGGGGGASQNGFNSGAGGAGAPGIVQIITWK